MARGSSAEPFPTLSSEPGAPQKEGNSSNNDGVPRRRRTSSNLPGEIRGDTGGVAFSTFSNAHGNGPPSPVTPTSEKAPAPFTKGYKRRKAKSLLRRWRSISYRHTWLNPLIVALILLGIYYINPGEQNPLHRAIFLSYPIPNTNPVQYAKGGNDFVFVGYYTIVLTFTREFIMQRILRPAAIHFGITSRAKQSRFMEQAYTAIYFSILGPFGLYVMSRSPVWFFNTRGMFIDFPHKTHEGIFKAYYLLQAAYWSQQAIVLLLLLEKPRKDFKELVGHHIITIALIWCSYRFHFTYMGLAVYITHDVSDFFLATSKVLNYIDSPVTVPFFAVFIGVWAYARHYINLKLLWAVLTEFKYVGPFELNWETQQYKCWISQYITFALLASLQAVNLFWFFLILRIAKRIAFEQVAKDDRSDDGDEEEEVQGSTKEKREQLGIKTNGDAQAGVGKVETPTPTVLLNGEPVDDASLHAHTKLNGRGSRSSGRKSPEGKGQDRRRAKS